MEYSVENTKTGHAVDVFAADALGAVDVARRETGETGEHTYRVTTLLVEETTVPADDTLIGPATATSLRPMV